MRTSSAKAKGRRLQQLVRDAILATYKSLTENDVRSTGMGQSGVDVQLSEAAIKEFPYSVECKNKEKLNVYAEWAQATENILPGTEPLLIIKKNRHDTLAVIKFEHFMELQRGKEKV